MTGDFKRNNIVISTEAYRFFIGSVMEESLNFSVTWFKDLSAPLCFGDDGFSTGVRQW